MANVFKNAVSVSVIAETSIYAPIAGTGVIIGLTIANVGASEASITVLANGGAVIKEAPVPVGAALSPLLGKIVLEVGQELKVSSDIAVDVIASILEIS